MCASRRIPNKTLSSATIQVTRGCWSLPLPLYFCLCLCVFTTTCSTRQADDGMVGPQRSEPFVDVGAGEHSPDDRWPAPRNWSPRLVADRRNRRCGRSHHTVYAVHYALLILQCIAFYIINCARVAQLAAARMQENGERMRKWRRNGERMREWRENE